MTPDQVLQLGVEAMDVSVALAMPLLGITLALGLVISIFQAATQINEMTLSFIPKLIGLVAVLIIFGPWFLDVIINYAKGIFESIPEIVRYK
jgi:flagellar biosynthetic protein FliQ